MIPVLRLTAPGSTPAWPAWWAAASSQTGSGSMSYTALAEISLLGGGAASLALVPTAKMRTDPPLEFTLGCAGA